MEEMPTLGSPRRRSARGLVVVALVGIALGGGLLWRRVRGPGRRLAVARAPASNPSAKQAVAARADLGPTVDGAEPSAGVVAGVAGAAVAAVATDGGRPTEAPQPKASAAQAALVRAGVRFVAATIQGPLETTLVAELGRPLGQSLAPVVVRTLVWWVNVPDDLRRGDQVLTLFEPREGAEPLVDAVRFKSEKAGRSFRAYRFKPAGETYARLYTADGQELERRLRGGPIDDYEQVTSLLRDGRGHKGVDFKMQLGTPVKAPFDGVVVRRNWKFRANGNSLEIRESGGAHHTAIFLHLSEAIAVAGAHVHKGQLIGKSGNTGHSFAPHLHYQLMSSSGAVLDPFEVHETFRRSLEGAQKKAFVAEAARLDALMDAADSAR